MDPTIEEELNWFAEDPMPNAEPPRRSQPSGTLKSSSYLAPVKSKLSVSQKKPKSSSKALLIPKLITELLTEEQLEERSNTRASRKTSDSKLRPSKSKLSKAKSIKPKRKEKNGTEPESTKKSKVDVIESTRTPTDSYLHLMGKIAISPMEKLNLLEERDKVMRIMLEKEKTSTGKPMIIGTCPDMCPEKERVMRDVRNIVSPYEAYPDTTTMDHQRAIKEYTRSSADQEEPLPHELRPVGVLRMTMDYIVSEIMVKLDENVNENIANWYDFCWGRLRAIRKDIIQQQLCDMNTVTIVEECARFHICCFDRLRESSKSVFDEKINSETLMNCLKSLMYMYEDLRSQGYSCPNEAEFRAYMILLKLHSGFLLSEFQQFPTALRKSDNVREVIEIYTAYSNNMYSTYFMLLQKTTYLNACLMQRFFGHLRTRGLEIIVKAHTPPNKTIKLSVDYLSQTLKFDYPDDCIAFCADFGLLLNEDGINFNVSRNDFEFPETMFIEKKSSSLVANKRISLANCVLGHNEIPKVVIQQVHSSFSEDHYLKPSALDASDQQEKILQDTVDRAVTNNQLIEMDIAPDDSSDKLEFEDFDIVPKHLESISPKDLRSSLDDEISKSYSDDEEMDETEFIEMSPTYMDASDADENELSFKSSSSWSDTDESDYDSYTETPPPIEPTDQINQNVTIPEKQKTPELKKSPFSFKPLSPSEDNLRKLSEPFRILAKQNIIETSPEPQHHKKALEPVKLTQKAKIENENAVLLAKLRKKLSEKMKHVTAKKYARIWRAKVMRMKIRRQNESLSVRHVSMEEYMKLWGCSQTKYNCSTLDRLNKRKKTNLIVTALLHLNIIDRLDERVKKVGDRIAHILGQVSVKWADNFGNISQPQPVFWKIVFSLPMRSTDGAVFRDRLQLWCQKAFHMRICPLTSDVCCWITTSGVPVFVHPIITEGLDELDSSAQNISAAVVVRAKGWESADETKERLQLLTKLGKKPIPLAILTLGSKLDHIQVTQLYRDNFSFIVQSMWSDTDSLVTTLVKIAQKHEMENLKVQPLSLLVEVTVEKLLDYLHQDRYLDDELNDLLTEPNNIIQIYNSLIDRLEEEISHACFYNYYGLAGEIESLIKKLRVSHDIFPANYHNNMHFKSSLNSHMSKLKLNTFNWKFENSIDMVSELKDYCNDMECPHILSNLVRIINPPDADSDVELFSYLKELHWLPIVEILTKQRLTKEHHMFRVVYREDKIRELTLSHWWLTQR